MALQTRHSRMSDVSAGNRLILHPGPAPSGPSAAPAAPAAGGVDSAPAPADAPVLRADDPRWVLALRTRERMQGPLLRPADRQNLLGLGRVLGLTGFESNLVIAIVQDQARRGGTLDAATDNLAMVPRFHRASRSGRWPVALAWAAGIIGLEIALLALTFG